MRSQRLIAQWLLRQGWLSLSALRHWLEHSGHGYSGLHLLHVHRLYDAWRRGIHQPLCHTNKLHWTQYRRAQSGIQHRTASPTDITHTLYIATSMLCSLKSISQRKTPNRACSAQKAGGTYRRFKYKYTAWLCIIVYYVDVCILYIIFIHMWYTYYIYIYNHNHIYIYIYIYIYTIIYQYGPVCFTLCLIGHMITGSRTDNIHAACVCVLWMHVYLLCMANLLKLTPTIWRGQRPCSIASF